MPRLEGSIESIVFHNIELEGERFGLQCPGDVLAQVIDVVVRIIILDQLELPTHAR